MCIVEGTFWWLHVWRCSAATAGAVEDQTSRTSGNVSCAREPTACSALSDRTLTLWFSLLAQDAVLTDLLERLLCTAADATACRSSSDRGSSDTPAATADGGAAGMLRYAAALRRQCQPYLER